MKRTNISNTHAFGAGPVCTSVVQIGHDTGLIAPM
jgi:hypothetical protein